MAVTADEFKKERANREVILELLKAGGFTKEQLDEVSAKLKDEGPDAITAELEAAKAALDSSPEGRARLRDIMSQRKAERLSTKYAPFFQAILSSGDIATSLAQINQAKREAANLKQPALPAVPDIDPALNASIRDAQIGTYDQSRVAAPVRQDLQDQYQKDIALAKAIGGGQASTFGALGQVASLRRGRATANMIPLLDSVKAREQQRLDSLIGQRGSLIDQNYRNRFYQFRAMEDRYNQDAAAIGGLGAAGRSNLRSSVQNLLGAVPGVAARVPMDGGFGDKYSPYEQSLNQSLIDPSATQSSYSRNPMRRNTAIADYWMDNPLNNSSSRQSYIPQFLR